MFQADDFSVVNLKSFIDFTKFDFTSSITIIAIIYFHFKLFNFLNLITISNLKIIEFMFANAILEFRLIVKSNYHRQTNFK